MNHFLVYELTVFSWTADRSIETYLGLSFKLHVCLWQVCAELRFLLSQAQLKKEESEREVRDISSKVGRQLDLAEQVR